MLLKKITYKIRPKKQKTKDDQSPKEFDIVLGSECTRRRSNNVSSIISSIGMDGADSRIPHDSKSRQNQRVTGSVFSSHISLSQMRTQFFVDEESDETNHDSKKQPFSKLSRLSVISNNFFKTKRHYTRTQSYTQLLTITFTRCMEELNFKAGDEKIEEWVCLIHACMSGHGRNYHGIEHVFDISEEADAILTLSALFHDAVYFNLDGGINSTNSKFIADAVVIGNDKTVKICDLESKDDEYLSLVATVFGFQSGQLLHPFGGLNEFLSAVMAVRALGTILDKGLILQVAACIEATIPFRKVDPIDGTNPNDRLYLRVQEANSKFGVGLDEDTIILATKRASELANRDVQNFESQFLAEFVDNTWKLLPESNIPLQQSNVLYHISDFGMALKKTHGFLSNLDIDTIFHGFRGLPTPSVLDSMRSRARYNVQATCKYTEVKLLAIAIIESIALLTGGDAPLCMFLGDLPSEGNHSESFEDCLPTIPTKLQVKGDSDVFKLLWHGRHAETNFDVRNSPVGAYIYQNIGDAGVSKAFPYVQNPMTSEHAESLLREGFPHKEVLLNIIKACSNFAVTRRVRLRQLEEKVNLWHSVEYSKESKKKNSMTQRNDSSIFEPKTS